MSDIGEVTQRLEELHDAGVAANEMGELFLTDYAMETIATAKAKIESLKRENEELREDFRCASRNAASYCVQLAEAKERTITPEMREELSAALTWIEKQIDSGSDVTISRLHEHSIFGPAVVVSVRRGYSSPAKIYGETLVGAISTAANSDLLGEQG